jgi:hypothetical protein
MIFNSHVPDHEYCQECHFHSQLGMCTHESYWDAVLRVPSWGTCKVYKKKPVDVPPGSDNGAGGGGAAAAPAKQYQYQFVYEPNMAKAPVGILVQRMVKRRLCMYVRNANKRVGGQQFSYCIGKGKEKEKL